MRALRIFAVLAIAMAPLPAMAAEVETAMGAVTVPDDPQRVLVLNPALAGSLYALGVNPVAVVESTRSPTEEGYSSVWAEPARAAGTEVLPWSFDGFDMELIQRYEPDLIIGGGQGRPGALAEAAYEQLGSIAPTLLVSAEIGTWEGEMDFLAEALGREDEMAAALAAYADKVAGVKAAIALPPQPTAFVMPYEIGRPYFLPETTATPALFAEVGFEPDPLTERFPELKPFGTGDSVEVNLELVPDVLDAPSMIVVPWSADGITAADLAADPITGQLPAIAAGRAYDFPDFAYRFDYYGAMATLDEIARVFAKP